MQQAIWKDTIIAASDQTIVVEGNHYFPPDSVHRRYVRPSPAHTACPWKGVASYYAVVVDGETNPRAAWYYPSPKPAARQIAGYIAFWHGVKVRRARDETDGEPGASGGGWLRRLLGN